MGAWQLRGWLQTAGAEARCTRSRSPCWLSFSRWLRSPTGDDPLLAIPPDVYVRRLLCVGVPRHRKVPCPFHDDRLVT